MIDPREILKAVQIKNVDQAEVYFSSGKHLEVAVLDRKVEAVKAVEDTGCGIRVIKNKKLGFAYTSDFDPDVLEETIERAVENAKCSEADEFNSLPINPTTHQPLNLDLFDEKISKVPVKDKIELALKIEETAYKTNKRVKKTEHVSYSEAEGEVRIVNSNGLDVKYKSNYCGASAQVIATMDGSMEAGFGLDYVNKFNDLKPEKAGQEAAERAVQLLGAKPIKSQKIPLVFDPMVGVDILETLAAALSADAVQKGKSMFAGKINKEVGSSILNIIDNGRLANGLSTAPFDSEGVPTQETSLIKDGKLQTFLFNTYTANKGKTKSTGNAARGSFMTTPSIGTTNLYIPAGKVSPEEMIGSIKNGLYITRVMGIHTANPISGDFSVGAMGIMIENGQKTYPVRGITIAGNLIEMLEGLEAVASDLRFVVDVGSPTLMIHDMTVSGL
ncbi:TldD/PmbA family protein [Candidatus Margulisiibacteriota bacterium]